MSSLFVIPNLIYSGNPFLLKRLHEVVGEQNKDLARKTVMNVKYWYASMPDECKKVLHTLIDNNTFTIRQGTFLRVSPSEAYKRGLHAQRSYDVTDVRGVGGIRRSGGIIGVKSNEARSYSEAMERADLFSVSCGDGDEFSLIDTKNDFVFRVTTKTIALIDKVGNDIVVLNDNDKHALIIYGAIRGIQKVKENMDAWEKLRFQESLKDKILEVYNDKE